MLLNICEESYKGKPENLSSTKKHQFNDINATEAENLNNLKYIRGEGVVPILPEPQS